MGKIATWNDIREKFNVGNSGNRTPTKKEILTNNESFVVSGNYKDNQCVQLSDISFKETISIVWFDFPSITPTSNGLILNGGQIEESNGENVKADVWIKVNFSADVYGADEVQIKIPAGSWSYNFNNVRLFSGIDMSNSKTGLIDMVSGSSVAYEVEVDSQSYRIDY